MTVEKRKYFPLLDLLKWICALFVVSLHCFPKGTSAPSTDVVNPTSPIPMYIGQAFLHPILRIAVPVFFIVSSFLLFRKIEQNPESKWVLIGKFTLRTACLYLFWYVVGLAPTLHDIFAFIQQNNYSDLFRYLLISFTKGAPRGFWYLGMLVASVLITALIKGKKSFVLIFVISCVLYVYGIFNSTYFGIFSLFQNPVSDFFKWAGYYFEFNICLLTALIYVVIGKFFATHENIKIKGHIPLLIVCFLMMVVEIFLVQYFKLFVFPDAFFTLPIFVFLLIALLIKVDIKNKKFLKVMQKCRKVGSFLYLFHFQFFYHLYNLLDILGANVFRENYALIVIPYIVCVLLAFLLQTACEKLSKHKPLEFLKYSY